MTARPDPDYCESCGAHYTEPCDELCACESCQQAEDERARLLALDVCAGE